MTETVTYRNIMRELFKSINAQQDLIHKINSLIKNSDYTKVHPNEIINALEVAKALMDGETNIVLQAPMQSGKTGTIDQLCNTILKEIGFFKENQGALFLNSMTDKTLYFQNIAKLGSDRSNIKVMKMKDFKSHGFLYVKENNKSIIIRDEDQYGCGQDSSFDYGFFEKLRITHPEIPLVTVSATPFDILDAMVKNSITGKVISGVTGENYFGIKNMLNEGLIRDIPKNYNHLVPDENGKNTISKEIQEGIFHLKNFDQSVGIIRCTKTQQAEYLKEQLKSLKKTYGINTMIIGSTDGCDYPISEGLEKLNEITKFQKGNTILMIMGALSAGKDLLSMKNNIKFSIETRGRQISNAVQGLPGRMCGYHPNRDCLIYQREAVLEKYVEFEDNPMIYWDEEFRNSIGRDIKTPAISTQLRFKEENKEGEFIPVGKTKEIPIESLYSKDTEKELSFLSEESYDKLLSLFSKSSIANRQKGTRQLNHKDVNIRVASNYKNSNRVYKNWDANIGENFKNIFPNAQKDAKYGILVSNYPEDDIKNIKNFCGIKLFVSGNREYRTYRSSTNNLSMYNK